MRPIFCVFVVLSALSLQVAPAADLRGGEARAVAVAVAAFSHDPSWKHFRHYTVTVHPSGRYIAVDFGPDGARIWTTHGRSTDTFHIQTFGRSAHYVIDPATSRIVTSSFSRD
jgi:hypothetical protein